LLCFASLTRHLAQALQCPSFAGPVSERTAAFDAFLVPGAGICQLAGGARGSAQRGEAVSFRSVLSKFPIGGKRLVQYFERLAFLILFDQYRAKAVQNDAELVLVCFAAN
jgi:hypothetical protein